MWGPEFYFLTYSIIWRKYKNNLQSVLQIWTSLSCFKILIVVWFQPQANSHYFFSCLKNHNQFNVWKESKKKNLALLFKIRDTLWNCNIFLISELNDEIKPWCDTGNATRSIALAPWCQFYQNFSINFFGTKMFHKAFL